MPRVRVCFVNLDSSLGQPSEPRGVKGWVLVIEDEPAIADVIRLNLAKAGFSVSILDRGEDALAVVGSLRPVVIVLDINLPDTSGTEICRQLRGQGDWTPIVFVTARDDEIDRVLGLELGADDYVTKPFSPRELVARISAVVRRAQGNLQAQSITVDDLRLDVGARRVWNGEADVTLTSTEFDLLAYLMAHQGRIFDREQLLSAVWGYSSAQGTRTVDVHIAQLRGKLGTDCPIRTVRGVGYGVEARGARG